MSLFKPLRPKRGDVETKKNVENKIIEIKAGNSELRETFIKDFSPFVLHQVSIITKCFIDKESSEEFSIGLIAFNEAIDRYEYSKNDNFLAFAKLVIQSRVIDFQRSRNKDLLEISFSQLDSDNKPSFVEMLICYQSDPFTQLEIKQEVESFKNQLQNFNISIKDLVLSSPKREDSRVQCIQIAKILVEDFELFNKLKRKKKIPGVELARRVGTNRKTILRNEKFIIAVTIILNNEDLYILNDHIREFVIGGSSK